MDVDVSKTCIREIIHGEIFEIPIYFRFYWGFEPGTPRVLDGDRTSVLPNQEDVAAKILMTRQ